MFMLGLDAKLTTLTSDKTSRDFAQGCKQHLNSGLAEPLGTSAESWKHC
jgi:hypothetical protein